MVDTFNLYIDDSGTRQPDKDRGRAPSHGFDWFAFGGVLLRHEDEEPARVLHKAFTDKWHIEAPLRSANIRGRQDTFHWLNRLPKAEQALFYEELYQLLAQSPVIGIACVIDRPGYNARYIEPYGPRRWMLCKTAFAIVAERAAKYAAGHNRKLRIYVERGDKASDRKTKEYYDALRSEGLPFDKQTSAKYGPAESGLMKSTLYDFKIKKKSSPLMQLADLYLWPICMGGYDPNNRPYSRLKEDRKLIDCHLESGSIPALGIKYSCWELVANKRL